MPKQNKKQKYFRDPIHGYIEVSGCALDIIGTPFFQRLRRIKQLSFSNFVYHGAEHSRFGHSLGVYHLAKQLTSKLELKSKVKEEFCLAALLHDIGHHPFSHSFESVLKDTYSSHEYEHENYTEAIIRHTDIGTCISDSGLSKTNVLEMINGRYLPKESELSYLNDLISSELDLDRLDYLLRDSYYCGVPYGRFDLERLILSMNPKNGEIVVSEKGKHSIEMYVLARFYMYTQVYAHHTRRAFDIMLKSMFSKNILDELQYPKPIKRDIMRMVDFDDSWLLNQVNVISKKKNSPESLLARGILNRDPIRWVIRKEAFADAQTGAIIPEYTTIISIRDTKNDIAQDVQVDFNLIYFDEPWTDLPFENRYRPYSEKEKPIKIESGGRISDIASDESSLAFYIAKYMAQAVRIYTLREHRQNVSKAIASKYPSLKDLVWRE